MPRSFLLSILTSVVFVAGCQGDDGESGQQATESSSSGTGCATESCGTAADQVGDTTTGDTTAAVPDSTSGDATVNETSDDQCGASTECSPDFCVAPFNPKLGVFGRGPFECVAACVELQDEVRWCADVTACCDADAQCTDRGYCELPGSEDSTGGSATETGADETAGDLDTGTGGGSTG